RMGASGLGECRVGPTLGLGVGLSARSRCRSRLLRLRLFRLQRLPVLGRLSVGQRLLPAVWLLLLVSGETETRRMLRGSRLTILWQQKLYPYATYRIRADARCLNSVPRATGNVQRGGLANQGSGSRLRPLSHS